MSCSGIMAATEMRETSWNRSAFDDDLADGEISVVDSSFWLSYMDDKVNSVLGHFQKNFGGGLVKEDSTKKLDEYGSFLPVYFRESSSLSKGVVNSSPASVAPAVDVSRERNNVCASTLTSGEFLPDKDSSREASQRKNEPKSLKIRIKLGSHKLLPRSNSETDIEQIMKEFEVMSEPMLSPLSENLLCLKERESHCQKGHKSENEDASVNHGKVNPRPEESKGIQSKKSKGRYKVSVKEPVETLEMHRQCSAEGNKDFDLTLGNVKVKPQKSLSSGLGSKHATCDFSEQVFPSDVNGSDAMTSSGKKRKMNSEEVKESNIRNQKRAKILDGMNQKIVIAFKEARALKDTADRLKAEGLDREGTDLYFEAALKFLHVASLLEPKMTENGNFEEAADQSISTYYDTAKICGICAQDYEKCNKMAAAALAYKCMEVAFMKVVFIKHSTASKDQRDQSNLMKTVHSHKHILRLLNFARDMSNAVEASKKSFVAYSHARSYPKASYRGHYGISSVKRVLDFSFHDIDELLHLMRISMDGHQILH